MHSGMRSGVEITSDRFAGRRRAKPAGWGALVLAGGMSLATTVLAAAPPASPHPAPPPSSHLRTVDGSVHRARVTGAEADELTAQAPPGVGRRVSLGMQESEELFTQNRQSIAVLPGGGFAVVWNEGSAPEKGVRLQYVRPDGTLVFPDGGLELADKSTRHDLAVLAAHPVSGVIVAFGRWSDSGSNELIVQSVDGAGARRWAGEGVSAFGPRRESRNYTYFRLVPNADGGTFVCAGRDTFDGLDSIHCQRLTAAGERAWGEEGVDAGGVPGWRVVPEALADGAGGLLVFWRNSRDLYDGRIEPILIEGQRLGPDGSRLWGESGRTVRTTNLAERNYYVWGGELAAVTDGAGGAILAFNDWNLRKPPTMDVFAQRVAGDGLLLWGSGIPVAAGKVPQQLDALIAVPGGGAVVSVWEPRRLTYGPLRIYRLGAQGGQLWGAGGRPLSDPAATALDFSSFSQVDGNRLRTAWVHQQNPATFTFDIYVTEHLLNGVRLTRAAGLPLDTAALGQFLRGFAVDAARGVGLAVFEDFHPDEVDKYDALAALYAPLP